MGAIDERESTRTGASSYMRVAELALGGMGRVDLALRSEGNFRRLYAVKRLHAHLNRDDEFRDMFMEEARIAGLIQHPNVVSVLDVGEDDEGPFLIMDFVDGLTLSTLTRLGRKRDEPVPVQVCVRLVREMSLGLHAAHEVRDHDGALLGLVHRDLSPQNILVGWNGAVRVTDFGIAKALGRSIRTSTGILKGKMAYMSPEQLQFEEPDRRSDLFALGVILFELLAGRRLYKNEEGTDGPRRILKEPPPDIGEERPEVPASLVQLSFELLAKERDRRPADANEVATRLGEVLAEIVADEGAIEIAEWVDDLAAEERQARTASLAEAIAQAEARPMGAIAVEVAAMESKPQRRGLLAVVAASLLVGVAGIAAGFWAFADPEPSVVAPPQTADLAAPAEPAAEPLPPPLTREEPAPEGASPEPTPEPFEAEPVAEVIEAPARPRARARRRRAPRPQMDAMMSASTPMMTVDGWETWDSN